MTFVKMNYFPIIRPYFTGVRTSSADMRIESMTISVARRTMLVAISAFGDYSRPYRLLIVSLDNTNIRLEYLLSPDTYDLVQQS